MGETVTPGMMITTGLDMHTHEPFTLALVKLTEPKLVNGRMPPTCVQHGASAMTSAEASGAPARVWVSV
jgi:hypothetical protein